MKNYKLIPLLAVTAFLAGCNVNKSGVKEPKFAKMGKEVLFADFAEAFEKANLLGAWSDHENQHTPSFVMTYDSSETIEVSVNSKVGKNMKASNVETEKATIKGDMNNSLISTERVIEEKVVENEYTMSGQMSGKSITSNMSQIVNLTNKDGEEEAFLVDVSLNTNTYSKKKNLTTYDANAKKEFVENYAYGIVAENAFPGDMADLILDYQSMSVNDKECYKFYLNDGIFTVTYTTEYSTVELDDLDQVNSMTTIVGESKMQLDARNGDSFSFKKSSVVSMKFKAFQDHIIQQYPGDPGTPMFAGDEGAGTQKFFMSAEVKVQDVKLKAIDLASYHEYSNMR